MFKRAFNVIVDFKEHVETGNTYVSSTTRILSTYYSETKKVLTHYMKTITNMYIIIFPGTNQLLL